MQKYVHIYVSADKYQVWKLFARMQLFKFKQYKNTGFLYCNLNGILQWLFNTCCHTEWLSAPRNHTLFLPSITAVRSVTLWILFPMLLPAFRMKDPSV